ncbi:hypothetical protein FRC03_010783 [Tulasnella sp. 419]|nr:hypothetical protein FRC03_010783 [Tulasnella sp. 419]
MPPIPITRATDDIRPKRKITGAARRLATEARKEKQARIDGAVAELCDIIQEEATAIASDNSISVEKVIEGVLTICHKKGKARAPNTWNAFQHQQAEHRRSARDSEKTKEAAKSSKNDEGNLDGSKQSSSEMALVSDNENGDDEMEVDPVNRPSRMEAVSLAQKSYSKDMDPEQREDLLKNLTSAREASLSIRQKDNHHIKLDAVDTQKQIEDMVSSLACRDLCVH